MDRTHIFNNMIGSTIAEVITLPLCTIKTNHQVYNHKTIKETMRNIIQTSGYKGFYQASFPAILSQVLSTTTKYSFYRYFTIRRETPKHDILQNSLNGLLGGLCGSIITHPVDVWKNYRQRNMDYFSEIKKRNYKILYQGYSQNILKNIMLYSILFPTYDYYYSKTNNNIISSVGTTITAGIITQPVDYLKTRYIAGVYEFKINNLYKGFHLMLMRNIPHFMITMSVINYLNDIKK